MRKDYFREDLVQFSEFLFFRHSAVVPEHKLDFVAKKLSCFLTVGDFIGNYLSKRNHKKTFDLIE